MIFLAALAVLCFLAGLANPIYLGPSAALHDSRQALPNASDRRRHFDHPLLIELQKSRVIHHRKFQSPQSLHLTAASLSPPPQTSFSESNRIIDVLLFVLLRNGFLVTALQLTALVLSQIDTKATWSLIPSSTISKVYVLNVLAILTKPRDSQERSYAATPLPNIPFNGSSTQAGGVTCKSCRNRLFHRSTDREHQYGQFNLTEFLQDSSIGDDELCKTDTTWSGSKDLCGVARLEEGGKRTDGEYYLEEETNVGDIVIQVDKQEEVFNSPCDHSRQALHRPRQNVLGGDPFTTDSENYP
uniref:C2H2-type domain-containing protein n=1 Tax=Kwoniella bestiolae CBS 10118 TaxID=1296100 RepID=A0A1B9GB07_9TREE|nr:hypothetical protein I302_03055 [Kwoniella bestiolae CBS 10118]OCF28203.1 hypothetical protein I302_03055 [Kwoniella bestiolae CBS 10118]